MVSLEKWQLYSLKQDICQLATFSLSLKGTSHLHQHEKLLNHMQTYIQVEAPSLLRKTASRLRVIKESHKGPLSKYNNQYCGEKFKVEKEGFKIGDGKISFFDTLDRALHASFGIRNNHERDLLNDSEKLLITLKGNGKKDEPDWRVDVDTIEFCNIALCFIDDALNISKASD